ncbi:probable gluconokinase [Asterias rubens]|uniref:probable gluconokinase n=1 Tax=Asterias rubens TaxID=7604 RepID=UPI0014558C12|nr:probable gluconokinase [Asterias rubens]
MVAVNFVKMVKIVLLMGVCGSGKSIVGRILSEKVGWEFADADDFHPESNKQKMAQQIALTDQDRYGWLVSLHQKLQRWYDDNRNGILACSALKQSYRKLLFTGLTLTPINTDSTSTLSSCITLVYLKGTREIIAQRMMNRDHFMPVSLLDSQLETLEEPTPDEGVMVLTEDIRESVDCIVSHVINVLEVDEH